MTDFLTDRSRITCYHRCPRERFLRYHCRGTGLQLVKLNLATTVGSAIHKGVEGILNSMDVLEAAKWAIEKEWLDKIAIKEVISKDIQQEITEDQSLIEQEQKALIEGLVLLYLYIQYPRILQEYDIIATEKEINWELSPGIQVMSRVDAVLRSKESGQLVVYSLKTANEYNDYTAAKSRYDDQGISELIAVERFYKEPVEGVLMNFLIKGRRRTTKDKITGSKSRYQDSFLVHPYRLDTGLTTEYALKYSWVDEDGSSHRLGKGWSRTDIWMEMPIKEWIEYLVNEETQTLESLIVTPPVYYRNEGDVKDWLEQNIQQEQFNLWNLQALQHHDLNLPGSRESDSSEYKSLLNKTFPYRRNSCYQFGGYCDFVPICWEGEKTTSQLYESRIPHHELEVIEGV